MVEKHQSQGRESLASELEAGSRPTPHVLWLRLRTDLKDQTQLLETKMRNGGLALNVANALEVSSTDLARADLILLDAFDNVDGIVETIVSRIRFESRVPLIMLTDGYSTEQLVTALSAGADAIWSLNMPFEILQARCRALLRRWLNHRSEPRP